MQKTLNEYISACRTRRFRAGSHDCALFANTWVKTTIGRDIGKKWRGKYRSLKAGQLLIERDGFASHVDIVAAHLKEIAPVFAQIGAIAVLDDDALGIVGGEMVFCLMAGGIGIVPRSNIKRAFALEVI